MRRHSPSEALASMWWGSWFIWELVRRHPNCGLVGPTTSIHSFLDASSAYAQRFQFPAYSPRNTGPSQ